MKPTLAGHVLTAYAVTGIYATLLAAAIIPPLLGFDPFTYHYAKKRTPPRFWQNPVFRRTNLIMTYVWAGIFALCTVLSLYPSVWTRAFVPIALIACFGLPFNARFPDYYLRRLGLPSLAEQSISGDSGIAAGGNRPSGMPGVVTADREARGTPAAAPSGPAWERAQGTTLRVLALNGSPRTEGQSKTSLLLDHLTKGMREAGADVRVVELRRKNIKYCLGCYTCWTKTPGVCVIRDDMTEELYPWWREADIVVYAFPLYHFTMNAQTKTFVERTLPSLQPFFHHENGRTRHPFRHRHPRTVILSVAGFPEISVFDQLSQWARHIFGGVEGTLIAEIYRPLSEALGVPLVREKASRILLAAEQAGREIVEGGGVGEETLRAVTQPFTDDDAFLRIADAMWRTCIDEGITPREFDARGLIPRPDSIPAFLKIMSLGFNARKAGAMTAVIQFNFSGTVAGGCHLIVQDGALKATEGEAARASTSAPEIFDDPRSKELLDRLRENFNLVIIDSPPIPALPDCLAISSRVDGVVLVVEAETTRWPIVEKVKQRIIKNRGNVLGIVLNKRHYYIPEWIYRRL